MSGESPGAGRPTGTLTKAKITWENDQDQDTANGRPTSMLDWALSYAKEGRKVFPCHERHYKRDQDGNPDGGKGPYWIKHTFEHGHLDATTDPKQIADWWIRWPNALIGSPVPADLIVLDLDPRKGGTIRALNTRLGPLPRTQHMISGATRAGTCST